MFIKTYDLNSNNLSHFNKDVGNGVAMLALTADWCGHCKALKPHWNKFQNKCKRKKCSSPVTVANCDAKYHNQIDLPLNVQGFPTIALYKNGKHVKDFGMEDGDRHNLADLEKFLSKEMKQTKQRKVRRNKTKKKRKKKNNKKNKRKTKKNKKRKKKSLKKKLKDLVKRFAN